MNDVALANIILGYADDNLILGHRNSEWTGHAPILEEDIAFANLALDELGHAQLWYELYKEMTGAEPDRVIYFRDVSDFRCAQFVELPKGDWAFSMLRQYLFDAAEMVRLPALAQCTDARIAEIANKIYPEEIYHLRHTSNWVERLGLGTTESHGRMQRALDELWGYALQLFEPMPDEEELTRAGVVPDSAKLQREWEQNAMEHLAASGLEVPAARTHAAISREQHTQYLAELVQELQEVARSEVFGVEW